MNEGRRPEDNPIMDHSMIREGDKTPVMAGYPGFAGMTRETYELYRVLVEAAQDMIFIIGRDGKVLYVNSFAAKAIGKPASEIVGKMRSGLFPVKVSEKQEQNLRRVFESNTAIYSEDLTIFPQKQIWLGTQLVPLLDENGNAYAILGISRDITESTQTEDALRESEERFRAIFEQAAVGMTQVDLDFRFMRVNQKFCDITGYRPEELIGRTFMDITYKPDITEEEKLISELIKGDIKTYTREKRYVRKDGSLILVDLTATVMYENGMPKHLIGVTQDISKRKRAEAELMRANRALKAISKCNEAMIHAKEEYTLLDDICKIFVEVGGYRMAWIGYAENDRDRTVRVMAKTGYEEGYLEKAGITWSNTEKGRGPTGMAIRTEMPYVARNIQTDPNFLPWRAEAMSRGYASALGLPLIADGRAFGALTIYSEKPEVFDMDEIVLLQELADNLAYGITSLRSQAKREQMERELKEAKGQSEMYLDLMGHDINNMNQIALGFLELALDTLKLDKEAVELISRPREALESSTNLINNVRRLQQAKNGSLQAHAIEVGRMLDEVIPRFSSVAGREITIRRSYECKCHVMANGLLDDVFSNIIGNAIKHSTGPLTIDVRVDRTVAKGREYCRVSVDDNGPGIPDEIKGTLFTRFQSGTPRASGKGLGLFLIKTLVEDFQGKAWIENRVPGDYTKGARFVVMLPSVEK